MHIFFVLVVFQHIPYFVWEPEEEDFYFNITTKRRLELLEELYKAGVRYVFCGHYHRNTGGKYKDLELVVTSAIGAPLGDDPCGFRAVNVAEKDMQHKYITIRNTVTEF